MNEKLEEMRDLVDQIRALRDSKEDPTVVHEKADRLMLDALLLGTNGTEYSTAAHQIATNWESLGTMAPRPEPGSAPSNFPKEHEALAKGQKRQVPSVNRAVHYFAYGTPGGEFPQGVERAAIITEVDEPGNPESPVGLCVLNPSGFFFNRHVPFSAENKPGCWNWPAFVPPVEAK